jgi:hypothetical protein
MPDFTELKQKHRATTFRPYSIPTFGFTSHRPEHPDSTWLRLGSVS